VFSGQDGKDSTFGRWHYEVMCLIKEGHDDTTVKSALRKSLKSPAAEVLRRLGEDADVDHILTKFQSLYGTVLSGEALLQKFYGEKQMTSETCAEWSCRIEDYMYEAIEQGIVAPDGIQKTLGSRFWSGLADERVKNALRNRDMRFEELVVAVRKDEEKFHLEVKQEMEAASRQKIKAQQITSASQNDKLDMLIDRLMKLEVQMSQLTQGKVEETSRQHEHRAVQQPANHQSHQRPMPQAYPKPQVRCHLCQNVGHLAFGCRAGKEVTCYRCNRQGHISASCLN